MRLTDDAVQMAYTPCRSDSSAMLFVMGTKRLAGYSLKWIINKSNVCQHMKCVFRARVRYCSALTRVFLQQTNFFMTRLPLTVAIERQLAKFTHC